ncbi:hypothetical protein A2697_01540 [Candidatus Curtissbacteria bacterium RIFCSPHIGHO2_01_FULL_41_44]|uniref:Glycosyltransferase RgtA/B/C/D-like domain-containing protein n=1 Tax=Candidatus Curtissbacteria bacterium RIFCSPLOWO2_01_FULL_42_50 TaxID=1797730 RepID=A0A1F5H6D9_9BACT|nr:MAG: hypothetical protein A2697_01540 [Candidatus Curtissbacteria bacterium RIFCSPHIGHO2_01_FULL_41_44]OGD99615.1 MAG: hypothetical protein A3B54_02920 [Candidatus Curtissbacteria bacterium RIFCSPLOWO2_01_FULL_42_50]
MDKIKIFFTILLFALFGFRIWQTTGCRQFASFYFNPLAIKINVEEQVSLDSSLNRSVSRFFHNKLTIGIFEITKSYMQTFEPRFSLETLGPLGLILILTALFKVVKAPNIVGITHLLIVLIVSVFAILPVKPQTSFYILAVTRFSVAFWGLDYFLRTKPLAILFFGLGFLTLWYFSISWQMPTICNEIFFN